MEITYLGHAAFKLKGKEGTVITDPFNPKSVGLSWNNVKADIVTLSHHHDDHNYVKGVDVSKNRKDRGVFIIDGAGEYEANDIMVQGWQTYHDDEQGAQRGDNVVYLITLDKIKVLHCGDLGHDLDRHLLEDFGQIDVLLIPVGGYYTIDAKLAAKITQAIAPAYVIPMHYQTEGLNQEIFEKLTPVNNFIQELGLPTGEAQDKLVVTHTTLPEDTQIVVLKR